jgi:hypothetical protein
MEQLGAGTGHLWAAVAGCRCHRRLRDADGGRLMSRIAPARCTLWRRGPSPAARVSLCRLGSRPVPAAGVPAW